MVAVSARVVESAVVAAGSVDFELAHPTTTKTAAAARRTLLVGHPARSARSSTLRESPAWRPETRHYEAVLAGQVEHIKRHERDGELGGGPGGVAGGGGHAVPEGVEVGAAPGADDQLTVQDGGAVEGVDQADHFTSQGRRWRHRARRHSRRASAGGAGSTIVRLCP